MGCYGQRGGDNGTVLMTAVTQEQEQVIEKGERLLDLKFFCLLFRSGMKFSAEIRFASRYDRNDPV